MEVVSTFKYWESYLPTPRHRKLRWREATDSITVTVPEATESDAPVVFRVYDLCMQTGKPEAEDIRAYNGKLYKLAYRHDYHSQAAHEPWPAKDMADRIACRCHAGPILSSRANEGSHERAIEEIRAFANSFLLVDGVVYHRTGEPMYVIHTMGLGHNHGGTHLSVTSHYNGNIPADCYFPATAKREAVEAAKKTALARGDTDSLAQIDYCISNYYIEVLDEEAVRRNPAVDHADGGCPFLQQAEAMIRGSTDKGDAAVGVMALAMLSSST